MISWISVFEERCHFFKNCFAYSSGVSLDMEWHSAHIQLHNDEEHMFLEKELHIPNNYRYLYIYILSAFNMSLYCYPVMNKVVILLFPSTLSFRRGKWEETQKKKFETLREVDRIMRVSWKGQCSLHSFGVHLTHVEVELQIFHIFLNLSKATMGWHTAVKCYECFQRKRCETSCGKHLELCIFQVKEPELSSDAPPELVREVARLKTHRFNGIRIFCMTPADHNKSKQ